MNFTFRFPDNILTNKPHLQMFGGAGMWACHCIGERGQHVVAFGHTKEGAWNRWLNKAKARDVHNPYRRYGKAKIPNRERVV